jgi:predicted DNA binding CopG/RHH family protein
MRPALLKIFKCLDIAGSDISNGSATSVTAISSSNNMISICLRVASESAENISSKVGDMGDLPFQVYLTRWLNIQKSIGLIKKLWL